MKKNVLLLLALTLFSVNVEAGLRELIQQNVQDADKSYEQTISPIEQQSKPPRLWIHVKTESQMKVGKEIFKAIADTSLGGRRIEEKPLQIVDSAPQESQLRYFKKEDESQAAELFAILQRLIPELKLKDLSRQYSHIRWIKTGHFELWLSPELVQIESSE
jgi:hypothetical protein